MYANKELDDNTRFVVTIMIDERYNICFFIKKKIDYSIMSQYIIET